VVVHHDCEVRLSIGQETVLLGIPSLTSKQLRRSGLIRCKHCRHYDAGRARSPQYLQCAVVLKCTNCDAQHGIHLEHG
jgi:hypothetical protein